MSLDPFEFGHIPAPPLPAGRRVCTDCGGPVTAYARCALCWKCEDTRLEAWCLAESRKGKPVFNRPKRPLPDGAEPKRRRATAKRLGVDRVGPPGSRARAGAMAAIVGGRVEQGRDGRWYVRSPESYERHRGIETLRLREKRRKAKAAERE